MLDFVSGRWISRRTSPGESVDRLFQQNTEAYSSLVSTMISTGRKSAATEDVFRIEERNLWEAVPSKPPNSVQLELWPAASMLA